MMTGWLVALCTLRGASSSRLSRGVAPEMLASYPSTDEGSWTCLTGSKVIPVSHINDEFCDCSDGSDEPGSAACSHFQTRFWCANRGFSGLNLYASRVNDGICDCCDGTDEYLVGKCEDQCRQLAAEANVAMEIQTQQVAAGLNTKAAIIEAGRLKRQRQQEEVAKLKAEIHDSAAAVQTLETQHQTFLAQETARQEVESKDVESKRAAAASNVPKESESMSSSGTENQCVANFQGQAGELVEAEFKGQNDWKNATVVSGSSTEDSYVVAYDADSVQEDNVPRDRIRPRPVDCGVLAVADKNAVSTCDATTCGQICVANCADGYAGKSVEYRCDIDSVWAASAPVQCELLPPQVPYILKLTAEDQSIAVEFVAASVSGATYAVTATPTGEDGGVVSLEESSATGSVTVAGLLNEVRYEVTVEATNVKGSTQAKGLEAVQPTALKKAYADAVSAKKSKETQIVSLEAALSSDLGPALEFSHLADKCIEKPKGKFTYKVCPFDKVEQKDGGSWTNLGKWKGFADGHSKMNFDRGTKCWNGPERSTTVILQCGSSDEILQVAEPETCAYEIHMSTPSVCTEAHKPKQYVVHEEL